jgi:hypothetical protein
LNNVKRARVVVAVIVLTCFVYRKCHVIRGTRYSSSQAPSTLLDRWIGSNYTGILDVCALLIVGNLG